MFRADFSIREAIPVVTPVGLTIATIAASGNTCAGGIPGTGPASCRLHSRAH